MDIKFTAAGIAGVEADALIVTHFQGQKTPAGAAADVDKALEGAISRLIKQGDIRGKTGENTHLYTLGKLPAGRVLVAGLGKKAEFTADRLRSAVAEACRCLRPRDVKSVATVVPGVGVRGLSLEAAAQAVAEGALLGLYSFRKYITKQENGFSEIKRLLLAGSRNEKNAVEQGIARGRITAEAVNWARDLVNEPGSQLPPSRMAEAARELAAGSGLEVEIWEPDKIKEAGMGALLGVARGSQQPPRFIILKYMGGGSDGIDLAMVGKGITFDSGGLNIKGSEWMLDMEGDMAGGAAVIAAISAAARLKAKLNVLAVVPAAENMPSGSAMKPGDIVTAMNGRTIEVLNTDAEGRLILADALSYVAAQGAKSIVDVATLTGACMTALGKNCTGAFTNNQPLAGRLLAAGREAGENAWQLPMYEEYREQLKSDMADIKNIGSRYAGAITAAKFLEEFVDKIPWVHLDIAGTSDTDKDKGYQVKGATGVPVRTLVNLILALAGQK